jgi:hypothetical protein
VDLTGIYDSAYLEKYRQYASTDLGRALTAKRVEALRIAHDFLGLFDQSRVLDVGCAAGAFVAAANEAGFDAYGYDVMPQAMDALGNRAALPSDGAHICTFWDSLEHMVDPESALRWASRGILVSIPVAETREEWLSSRHFRPGEHLHYWSRAGFVQWVRQRSELRLLWDSDFETVLGRDRIHTYLFGRKP